MADSKRRAWASIDGTALKKNLAQVRVLCPNANIVPVIKANAYGHGLKAIAGILGKTHTAVAALAVATIGEAERLHALNPDYPILLLNGFTNLDELGACQELGIEPVVHSLYQVEILQQKFADEIIGNKRRFWLKQNTGMNRLGLSAADWVHAYQALHKFPDVDIVLMSHLACADEPDNPDAVAFTQQQLAAFAALQGKMAAAQTEPLECSLAASSAILSLPEAHYQTVRPGIMLYGGSPLTAQTGEELGLLPVMTLSARLLAINDVAAGASVGYGAEYTCDRQTRVGVVSIGYGDGYPRSAINGTPVLVKCGGAETRTRLIGRVSMDTITIDLTDLPDAQIGDEVVLWGAGLCADEVARTAGTIAYELFCQVTNRVPRLYV